MLVSLHQKINAELEQDLNKLYILRIFLKVLAPHRSVPTTGNEITLESRYGACSAAVDDGPRTGENSLCLIDKLLEAAAERASSNTALWSAYDKGSRLYQNANYNHLSPAPHVPNTEGDDIECQPERDHVAKLIPEDSSAEFLGMLLREPSTVTFQPAMSLSSKLIATWMCIRCFCYAHLLSFLFCKSSFFFSDIWRA